MYVAQITTVASRYKEIILLLCKLELLAEVLATYNITIINYTAWSKATLIYTHKEIIPLATKLNT